MTLLAETEVVAAGRVRLAALTTAKVEAMASWLPAALAPEWTLADLQAHVDDGVLIEGAAGEPLGAAVALLGRPAAGDATLPFLAIDPARRFRGLGGEAGLALERYLRRRYGVQRVYAPVPDWRGLAVYFWLRLGLRPLTQRQAPGPLLGLSSESMPGIWLLRDGD